MYVLCKIYASSFENLCLGKVLFKCSIFILVGITLEHHLETFVCLGNLGTSALGTFSVLREFGSVCVRDHIWKCMAKRFCT